MPSHWDANKFAVESESSPFPEVRSLGLAVAGEGLDCYLGDLNKNVAQPGHRLKDADAMACRVKLRLVEACEAGKAVGPSPCPQFPFSKEVLPFTVPKDPHDPYSTRVRPVFHFSADPADGPSTNDLCVDPFVKTCRRPSSGMRFSGCFWFLASCRA